MSRRRGLYNGVKEQVGRAAKSDAVICSHKLHGSCTVTKERPLPPRVHSISLAARVIGREIRNGIQRKTTGKDSAQIRDSKLRNEAIKKISNIKVAMESPATKTSLFSLACCHSTNFTKSMSPEGADMIDIGFGRNLVARFHQQCRTDGYLPANPASHNLNMPVMATSKHKFPTPKLCRCHESLLDVKKECCSFLGCWEHKGIKEDDLNSFLNDNIPYFQKSRVLQQIELHVNDKGWKEFLRNDKCTVFRRELPTGIYKYRVHASFSDVSASKLFRTQIDGEYRQKWDHYVVDLKIVDSNQETASELVQWVTKCPYPFSTREYIYLRRHKIDKENKAMVLLQKATDKTDIPCDPKIMRVDTYLSKIIVKPHGEDFNENGCDFLLSYYDDPKMKLPSRVMDLASSRGITDSVSRMHKAALGLDN